MKKSDYKIGEDIQLEEMNVILKIPANAARLEMTVHMFDDEGEAMKVHTCIDASMIRDARQAFLDNVEFGDDYDAKFVLTEKGREWLDAIDRGDPEAVKELNDLAKMIAEDDE